MPVSPRTLAARIAALADAATAAADTEATNAGLTATARSRWNRVYTDPRMPQLRAARAAGCTHLPVHLDPVDCPIVGVAPARKAA